MLPPGASGSGTADGYGLLGSRALPRQLILPPVNGRIQALAVYAVASGTITIPSSAVGAAVNIVLNQNYFKYTTDSSQTIEIVSDPMMQLNPPAPLAAGTTTSFYFHCALGGSIGTIFGQYNLYLDDVLYASGTNISHRYPEFKLAIVQLSLGMAFSGAISGGQVFSASLTQFELQQRSHF